MQKLLSEFKPNTAAILDSLVTGSKFSRYNKQASKIRYLGLKCVDMDPNNRPNFDEIHDELIEITTQVYLLYMVGSMYNAKKLIF